MLSLLLKAKGALAGIWGYVATGLAAMAGLLAMYFSAKKAGKDEAIKEVQKEAIKTTKEANEIRDNVRRAPDSDVDKRLSKYRRGGG